MAPQGRELLLLDATPGACFAVRVCLRPYPEGVLATWVMLGLHYAA